MFSGVTPCCVVNVFVYGTLKPGEVNYQRYCAAQVISAKRAIAFGKLYALPFGYPAMILGDLPVQGYVLSFPNSNILTNLDLLEDYNASKPDASLYNRQLIITYNPDFTYLGAAWVYLMTPAQVDAYDGVLLADGWWSS